jgi:DNA invertase Pin-like site-specific DNA recombinase
VKTGDLRPGAKLTAGDVDLLRRLRAEGWSQRALARKFEVSRALVRWVCSWRKRVAG